MKSKKVPMRTCVVTKEKCNKKDLIRIVRDNLGNVSIDLTGKKNGRGAYLKKDTEVIKKAEETKILEKHLEVLIPQDIYEKLKELASKN